MASGEDDSNVLNLSAQDEGYASYLYNNRSGLPTPEANAIVQTAEGFIWIGCYSGLIRYDGNTFERMDSTTGIASVVSLFVDSKNRLWVGTNDSGVAVIDKGNIRMFNKEDGLKSLSVQTITEDDKGNILVGTTRGIAEIDEGMTVRTIESSNIRNSYILELVAGPNGIVYGVTRTEELFTLKDGVLNNFYKLVNKHDPDDPSEVQNTLTNVTTVLPDPDHPGYIYLGSKGCVYYGRPDAQLGNYVEISVESLSRVNQITKIAGYLWFCADNGIGYLDETGIHVLNNLQMQNVSVEHMMDDYQGNLWFTSTRAGVMKLVRNRFANISEWCELPENLTVNSTLVYENRLLVGSDSGLLVVEDMKTTREWPINSVHLHSGEKIAEGVTSLVDLLDGCRIRCIYRDSRNRLWFCTFSDYGLVRYDNGDVVCFVHETDDAGETIEGSLPSNRSRTVWECHDGTILAVCTGGLAVIRDDTVEKIYNDKTYTYGVGLSNAELLTVAEAENGDYIVGTDGGGIYILSGDQAPRCIDTTSGLRSDIVMRVKYDKERNVYWIVTSNSLAYMDSSYKVTTIQNFPYSNNFDLYINSKGEAWILSSNGIYVVSAETLLANGEIDPIYYSFYNGLPFVATSNSYSALTEAGDLYIAGMGVARVNIENQFEDIRDLKMGVPYVVADGKEIYPDEDGTFRIPSSTKKLVIHGFVFTYALMNPLVTYRLEGLDHGDTTVNRNNFAPVSYTNLRGGTYYFKMSIKDIFGVGDKEISIKIVKSKAVYETWWFQLIAILIAIALICLLVVLYVKRKTRKLLEKEEEQKTFINEMTEAFAKTIDMKDSYTNGHSFRVAKYTTMLAEELGCSEEDVEKYHNIALLHDIGKIGVDDKVLKKEGKLDDDEFKQIKSHSALGYRVLKDISIMPELAIGAGAHHERPDGKGYPKGLKGDEIPRVAQIIAVADTFDAMYSDRPYRKRMNFEKAVSIIRDAAGTQLAADVVDAFLRLVERGFFRAPDDDGGGTVEDIDNIHKGYARAEAIKEAHRQKIAEGMAAAQENQEQKPEAEESKRLLGRLRERRRKNKQHKAGKG